MHRAALRSTVATVVILAGLLFAAIAWSAPKVVELKGVGYNVEFPMKENLKALAGKSVYVSLTSGKQFAGKVKAVGSHMLHLEKIEGKDYFDALVRIDQIEAIDTRFREIKR